MKLWSLRNVVASRSTESLSDGTSDIWARGTREASSSISPFWFWRRLRAVALFSRLLAACLALLQVYHYMHNNNSEWSVGYFRFVDEIIKIIERKVRLQQAATV